MTEQEYIDKFRARALNPNHPSEKGSAQNPDISSRPVKLRIRIMTLFGHCPEVYG
jgi:hypothetical protein